MDTRYTLLDLHNSLYQAGLVDVDCLGDYGIPDHPLGQIWFGWEAFCHEFDPLLMDWGSGLLDRKPSLYLIAEFQSLLVRLPNFSLTHSCEGRDIIVPRLLAAMDYRRAGFLYPNVEGFSLYETALKSDVHITDASSLRSYRQRCYTAMIALCDVDIDPTVTWNRLCTMGRLLYYRMVLSRLSPTCPHTSQAARKIANYHTYLKSETCK